MLDQFVQVRVDRFSPESPTCPVLDFQSETKMLGGAGNVATNLVALGACAVRLLGLIGHDSSGRELSDLVRQSKVADHLFSVCGRPTTTKVRYITGDKHLMRFDRETTKPADEFDTAILLNEIHKWAWKKIDGIVLQDYAKGVVTPYLIRALMDAAKENDVPVFVDPKSEHWQHFRGAALVKPNLPEIRTAFGVSEESANTAEFLGRSMLQYTRAEAVVVTRGRDGMSLFTEDEEAWIIPNSIEVVDVSGAGDTSMAALVLCRLAGASWVEALELANAAAGIAVGKRGTSIVTADELLNKFPEEENDAIEIL